MSGLTNMPQQKTILAIQAHPDDTEIFCSGTLALLAQQGHRVVIATMTSGNMGGIGMDPETTAERRKKEAAEAARLIGAEYICMEQPDGFVFDSPEIRVKTNQVIRQSGAHVVLTHLPDDYHPDHRATSSIVESATLLTTLPNVPCDAAPLKTTPILYHTTPFNLTNHLGTPYTPHFYVDVSSVIETKKAMIAAHDSQVELMRVMFDIQNFVEDMLDGHDRKLGADIGLSYAEAFWQHLGGGFPHAPFIQDTLKEHVHTVKPIT